MTNIEFVKILYKILNRKTAYRNIWPENVGYFNGDSISFDCWNLVKAIYWDNSIADNYDVGRYAAFNPSSGLGDWNGIQILDACYEVSTDMANIPIGAFLLYEDASHAGVYVGDRAVIECTPAWGMNCVCTSEIDLDGNRRKGACSWGRWSHWGKLPNMEYLETKKWHKNDLVVLPQGSYIYGTKNYFASWVYDTKLEVMEEPVGDRVVISHNGVLVGACYGLDLMPYVEQPVDIPAAENNLENKAEISEQVEEKEEDIQPKENTNILVLIWNCILSIIRSIFYKD